MAPAKDNESLDYRLGRIEEKLDSLLGLRKADAAETTDNTKRILSLELWRARSTGYTLGIAAVCSLLFTAAWQILPLLHR